MRRKCPTRNHRSHISDAWPAALVVGRLRRRVEATACPTEKAAGPIHPHGRRGDARRRLRPAEALTVKAGETVTFVFHNAGKIRHDAFLGDEAAQAEHEKKMREQAGMGGHGHGATTPSRSSRQRAARFTHTFQRGRHVGRSAAMNPATTPAGMKLAVTVVTEPTPSSRARAPSTRSVSRRTARLPTGEARNSVAPTSARARIRPATSSSSPAMTTPAGPSSPASSRSRL